MTNLNSLEDLLKYISKNHISTAKTFQRYAEIGEKLPPLIQVWGNYILDKSLTHFPAKRGCGKSLLAMQLCLAIANNHKEFLGEKIGRNGNCLYLDFEMSEDIISRRASTLKNNTPNYKSKLGDKLIIYSTKKGFIEDFGTINNLMKSSKFVLVVIDNLRNAIKSSNTNNSSEMATFFSILNGLKECYGLSIIIIDHFRKNTDGAKSSSDLQSGSGAKSDGVDGDFLLRNSSQNKHWRLLCRIKSRMVEESNETKLIALNPETLWFEIVEKNVNESEHLGLSESTDKEELKDRALDLKEKGHSLDEIAKILGKGKTTIHRWTK